MYGKKKQKSACLMEEDGFVQREGKEEVGVHQRLAPTKPSLADTALLSVNKRLRVRGGMCVSI